MPELANFLQVTCEGKEICDLTGLPHLSWKPQVMNGAVHGFNTEEEAEYPQCSQISGYCCGWFAPLDISQNISRDANAFGEFFPRKLTPQAGGADIAAQPVEHTLYSGGRRF